MPGYGIHLRKRGRGRDVTAISGQAHLTVVPEHLDPGGELANLAGVLYSPDYMVVLLPWGSLPHLRVTSRDTGLVVDIYCDGRNFWWRPYGQPITAVDDVAFTAQAVRLVLAGAGGE